MALSLEQQNALDSLPPPDSLERILRFLSDLGTQGSSPLGETGRAAEGFAASLGGGRSFSARQTSGWVAILMDRYQIKMIEIQDFALWFVRRQEIFAETAADAPERVPDLAERAPSPVLARLPAPTVRTAALASPAAFALAAPAAAQADVPSEIISLPPVSASAASPRTALRRQPVMTPTEADDAPTTVEDAPTELLEQPALRRRPGRVSGNVPRLRRIERAPSPLESGADTEPEPQSLAEEPPPPAKRPFRLTPQMVTRPAFVTNIGLAGLLTGMSLAPVQADTMLASPAMTLATPSPLNIGPAPLNIGPTWSALPGQPPAPPLGVSAFTPTVTPMAAPTLPASVPPVQLGMPSPPPAPPLPFVDSARISPVSAALKAPSTALLSSAPALPLPVNSPVDLVFSKPLPAGVASPISIATAPPSVDSPPRTPKLPSVAQAVPGLLGMAAASVGLATAADLIGRPVLGTTSAPGQSAVGQTPPSPADTPEASPNAALTPLPLFTGQANRGPGGTALGIGAPKREAPTAATPEMGQITLVAPPLQVASAQAERSGIAASVDWKTLAGGAGPLDEGSLARLKPALPPNAALLYPALPPGRLGAGAVNLPLSAPLVQSLLQKNYGQAAPGLATRAADLGNAASGGAPAAMPLPAQIVPGKRPIGTSAGVLGHADEEKGGAGALAEAGQGQAKRGGVLDFLGLPVRLAPSLSGGAELARETAVRSAGSGPVQSQQTLRPEQFAPLRNRLFPAFHSMAVEPDKAAWRQAAPAFGLRDGKPTTVLAPDARVPVQTPTSPLPALGSQPSASSSPSSLRPMALLGGLGSIASGLSQALPRSGGGLGSVGSGLSQAFGHSGGSGGFGSIGSGVSQALGRSSGGLGNIASGLSQALPRSGGGFGSVASGLSQALPHSGGGLGSVGSGLSQAFGHSGGGGGFGSIGSGVSQAVGRSSGGLGGRGLGGRGLGGRLSGASQAFGQSGGGLGSIASGLSQAQPRSGGGFGSIASGLSQARERSRWDFPHLGSVAPTFGHPPHRHLTPKHRSSGTASFSPNGSHALPSVNLATPRTVSYGLSPSQIVRPRGASRSSTPTRTMPGHPTGSRVVNFGPTPSSAGSVPAMRFVTPRPASRAASESPPPMTIQRSETTTKATPARNEGARTQAEAAAAPAGGAAGSEVNALAGEVWSLLKRRLATEAERSGRR